MSVIIETAIANAIQARIEAITPRYLPKYAFKHYGLDDLEETKQTGAHRWFGLEWGQSLGDETAGRTTEKNFVRPLLIKVLYRVPARDVAECESYFAADTADIDTALIKTDLFNEVEALSSDGSLFYIEPFMCDRTFVGTEESHMLVILGYELRYQRRLS